MVAVCRWSKDVTQRSVARALGEWKFQRGEVRKSNRVKMAMLKASLQLGGGVAVAVLVRNLTEEILGLS